MAYVFHNLSDEQLTELSLAVREEQKRRFLSEGLGKYPKLEGGGGSAVEGVEAYRHAYSISLANAFILFNYYHRGRSV